MDLPIPIFTDGRTFRTLEIKKPTPGVLADTKRAADEGSFYQALQTFIQGCVISAHDDSGAPISDKAALRPILAQMAFRSADYTAIQVMLLMHDDDGIEGVYPCPRCQKDNISEANSRTGVDTRDFLRHLTVNKMPPESVTDGYLVELSEPVEVKIGDQVEEIKSLGFRWPTLADCIRATSRVGVKDEVRLQLNIYAEAIVTVNGAKVDAKFKTSFGTWVLENLKDARRDMALINNPQMAWGLDPHVEKVCRHCGKEFKVLVNTANFFVSGFQQG